MDPVENTSTHAHGGPNGVRCEPAEGAGSTPFAEGTRISDSIELVRLLGTGGMGSVWLAEHGALETQVAVKFMSKEVLSEPGLLARFAREAKLSARIKSPHVVQIFDFATTADGVPYIVMELLEGEDLETRLQGGRELGLDDASRVIIQLCKALAKAHALGIVHRDIKPDNVFLVDNDGEILVKVLDFGIAKDESSMTGLTVSGTTMGTPLYMSPEQLFDLKDVDFRTDLWSVAVLAYRCLTGRLPFEGTSFGSICVAIHAGVFTLPSELSDKLPPGLDGWFRRALSQKREDRFGSAQEMADAFLAELDRAGLLPGWAARRSSSSGEIKTYATDAAGISGAPITLRPSAPARRSWRWTGAAVAALAFAIAGAAAARRTGGEPGSTMARAEFASSAAVRHLTLPGQRLPPLAETTDPPSRRSIELAPFVPPGRLLRAIPDRAARNARSSAPSGDYDDLGDPSSESAPADPPQSPAQTPETIIYGI
jgi:serine/threonine-protein kinase